MLEASSQVRRPGRATSLVGGALLLGGLSVLMAAPSAAQDPPAKADPAKADAAKKEPAKRPAAPLKPREHLNLTIESLGEGKSASQDVATTRQVVKTINDMLGKGWTENNIEPSRFVDDHDFIRRASLDVIGRIAKPAEIAAFLKDPEKTRRSRLIERLLDSPEYAQHWADVWANWLLTRSGVFGSRSQYHEWTKRWLEDQFARNVPYNKIVEGLITATGDNEKNGAVNFILAHLGETIPPPKRAEEGDFEMVPITSRMTRLFLGTQVQCAQCHDHPFHGNIKQEHFWGVNAFLRQVKRQGTPPMARGNMMTYDKLTLADDTRVNKDAAVFYEKRNGVVLQKLAQFLPSGEAAEGQSLPTTPGQSDNFRRQELARFMIEHEQFPRAIVNRMWGVFLGRGFVNPIDDFNDQNLPSNPELLNELATQFKHYNYDLKKLIRWIANSEAYNLSCVANKTNDKPEQEPLFSRMVLKSMSPEQLFESLMVATNAEASETKETKKKLRDDWMGKLISNFGDDEGNEVNFNGTVVQALLMMNGDDINTAITRKDKSTVAVAMSKNKMPAAVIGDLFLATLNRRPSPTEVSVILKKMKLDRGTDKDPAAPYQDVFWALLNSNEFLLNH